VAPRALMAVATGVVPPLADTAASTRRPVRKRPGELQHHLGLKINWRDSALWVLL
jgi:hypothetical protein